MGQARDPDTVGAMLSQLLAHDGVEETAELRSPVGFMALHGGSLERGTAEIAHEAASRAGASYYGVTQPEQFRWHVPSAAFDPAQSSTLAAFIDHVDVALAIHGYGRPELFTTVLLGGRNRQLCARVAQILASSLPDYTFEHDLDRIPRELRGQNPANPVNLPRQAGAQIELPPRIRGLGPHWERHPGPCPHTEDLIEGLAAVARACTPAE
jgi:phage replication-related protein YjqB (UPF0714/DUF867 family)